MQSVDAGAGGLFILSCSPVGSGTCTRAMRQLARRTIQPNHTTFLPPAFPLDFYPRAHGGIEEDL